jgi:hypothetical protein
LRTEYSSIITDTDINTFEINTNVVTDTTSITLGTIDNTTIRDNLDLAKNFYKF